MSQPSDKVFSITKKKSTDSIKTFVTIPKVVKKKIIDITSIINDLLKTHILTSEEIANYLVENPEINFTEKELICIVENLVNSKELLTVKNQTETLIFHSDLSEKHSRIESKVWVETNTTLNSLYKPLRKTYNNIIKVLKNNGINSYNQIFDIFTAKNQSFEVLMKNNKTAITFSSNDYLGLTQNKEIKHVCKEAIDKYGNGSAGSRIMTGTTSFHVNLEKTIAKFKNTEDAIVFSSGYLTNLALYSCFSKDTIIFFDSLDHACIIDGILLSNCEKVRFKHNDLKNLEEKLKFYDGFNKVIAIEGVYSLDGDIADLPEIVKIGKKYNAKIIIDEAHSSGTFGDSSRGISDFFHLDSNDIELKMGTLGKAFASQGGYIAGKKRIVDAMRYSCRPFLFSTSLPASVMAGSIKAIEIVLENPGFANQLQEKSKYVRKILNSKGFNIGNSKSQIIPIIIGSDELTHKFQKKLEMNGYFLNAITYPAVPPKTARLRLNITLGHSDKQINELIENMVREGEKLGII